MQNTVFEQHSIYLPLLTTHSVQSEKIYRHEKTVLLFALLGSGAFACAQQALKVTFENAAIGSAGGAVAMWSGAAVDVIANTCKTGNPSDKVWHCNHCRLGEEAKFFSGTSSHLTAGVYLLQAVAQGKTYTAKRIK